MKSTVISSTLFRLCIQTVDQMRNLILIFVLLKAQASESKQHPTEYFYKGHIPGLDLWKLKNRGEMHKCLQ